MARILIRTDGGAGIGLGHLQRCLSLATALQRAGALCFFAIHGDEAAAARALESGFASRLLSTPSDDIAAVATEWECDAVVVDSYETGGALLTSLRDAGLFVAAIDDLAAYPLDAHLVVSFGPHAHEANYESVRSDTRFLLGPRYTILRPEYWDVPLMPPRERVRNILVTTGGADPTGVMPSWIEAVDGIDADFDVTAIVGPFFAEPGAVHAAAAAAARTVRVVDSPRVTRPMQAMADIAVTAAGQTIYELAALGVPTVAAEIAANQRPQLDAFAKLGAMIDAGAASDAATAERIATIVERLLSGADERRVLSETARAAVDRRGAVSVAAEIAGGIAAHTKGSR
ncbi:MAG TPA: UDP-2,4-diacetamido-2,4,6-trideoxy-beta-L-altropyranose hydrolase [Actinomycetota bacterium]|nr:UDP-2,4-diacetamido-2,4,6-trideoxy-beta-L-altropyranose hydrolase [Actinomycetota bacterium]